MRKILLQKWKHKLWHKLKLNNKVVELPLNSHQKKWHKFKPKLKLKPPKVQHPQLLPLLQLQLLKHQHQKQHNKFLLLNKLKQRPLQLIQQQWPLFQHKNKPLSKLLQQQDLIQELNYSFQNLKQLVMLLLLLPLLMLYSKKKNHGQK